MTNSLPNVPDLVVPYTPTPQELLYSLAIIIDNTVYQVISTDGQSAALFLSNPTFVQVDKTQVEVGQIYDSITNEFTNP